MEKLVLLVALLGIHRCAAAGAGRAFPIDSENLAISTFKAINPSLEWDPTNYLVDLSGEYANCNQLHQKGEIQVDRKNPDGSKVVVVIDNTPGKDSDVNAVNTYIAEVLRRWSSTRLYHNQMQNAKRFGCSVRPGCSGYAVIACVFSSGGGGGADSRPQTPPQPYYRTTRKPVDPWDDPNVKKDDDKKPGFGDEKPKALAFTPEQYSTAEQIMGKKWDRAHFLENLSGFETDCSMIGRTDWPFDYAKKVEREEKIKITGQYGHTMNKGSTPDALKEILRNFKPVSNAKSIGCSVIPHCRTSGATMQVVIACLFEEN
jgi:hypothetical protein